MGIYVTTLSAEQNLEQNKGAVQWACLVFCFNEGAEVLPVEIYVEAEAGRDVIWDSA